MTEEPIMALAMIIDNINTHAGGIIHGIEYAFHHTILTRQLLAQFQIIFEYPCGWNVISPFHNIST
jgi:hypothetical protein